MIARVDHDRYALLIPTYNRPPQLAALLKHLASARVSFPAVVLDSSTDANKALNRSEIARTPIKIHHREFDSEIRLGSKLFTGLRDLETDYVSICADDDVLFPEAALHAVNELDRRPDCVACHGIYPSFDPVHLKPESTRIGVEYAGSSIDAAEPLERIRQILAWYEAPTYAVFRRAVYADVLKASQSIKSPLFWELFCALAPLASGKILRMRQIYLARCAEPQTRETNWHPALWFDENPDGLMREFHVYRQALLDMILHDNDQRDETRRALTAFHFNYFAREMGYKEPRPQRPYWWLRRARKLQRAADRRNARQLEEWVVEESAPAILAYRADLKFSLAR